MPTTRRDHRGRAFIGLSDLSRLSRTTEEGAEILTSPELPTHLPANEIVVSWNAQAVEGAGMKIEARVRIGDHLSRYYVLGLWSPDGKVFPRESVNGQRDDDGQVQTDTLVLHRPADAVQVRVTLQSVQGKPLPTLTFLGISLTDASVHLSELPPVRSVWGKEITVPGRPQSGWPGANGWCSPTSTDMTLAFWSGKLHRPELDLPVPDVAHAIYDKVYDGTGNWPFNTAFAGSFPGIRAYVARFSAIRELETWVAAGIPPIVSVSYDLLKGKEKDNDPGHLMVCDGFTSEGDIVLNDPAHHPERGEVCRRVFPRANFLRAWGRSHFTVYLIYPVGAKLPPDPYGHWEEP